MRGLAYWIGLILMPDQLTSIQNVAAGREAVNPGCRSDRLSAKIINNAVYKTVIPYNLADSGFIAEISAFHSRSFGSNRGSVAYVGR